MTTMTAVDGAAFAATQIALLEVELQSELAETSSLITNTSPTSLQRAGLAITNLTLVSQRTGLGGKTVVELGADSATSNSTRPSASRKLTYDRIAKIMSD